MVAPVLSSVSASASTLQPNLRSSANSSSSSVSGNKSLLSVRWTALANLDMYRKVPGDLLEGSTQGRVISWITILIIIILFTMETKSFLTPKISNHLALDNSTDRVQVRFNITMMDLKCEYATIDLVSALGTTQNITGNVPGSSLHKWSVDSEGIRRQYMDRNLQQHDIGMKMHDENVKESLEELHKDGEDAVNLNEELLNTALESYDFVFVDFFAMWCSHCRALAPTWEKFAEVMYEAKTHDENKAKEHISKEDFTEEEYEIAVKANDEYKESSIFIGKVDCVENHLLCQKSRITSYPTLRLFIHGKPYEGGDFFGHRTILNFINYVLLAEEQHSIKSHDSMDPENVDKKEDNENDHNHAKFRETAQTAIYLTALSQNISLLEKNDIYEEQRNRHYERLDWNPDNHPGCMMIGTFFLPKAPLHFYIQAQSKAHSMVPTMTNVSHAINHLSFGVENAESYLEILHHHRFKEDIRNSGVEEKVQLDTVELQKQYNEIFKQSRKGKELINAANKGNNKKKILYTLPRQFQTIKAFSPMDGNVYMTEYLHEAYHHYIKLVSINNRYYQMIQNSQLAIYNPEKVPEAKFIIDISPISVSYQYNKRRYTWYDYVTKLMAIIGGTFTLIGIIEGILGFLSRERIRKLNRKKTQQLKHLQHQHEQAVPNNINNYMSPLPPPPHLGVASTAANLHLRTNASQQIHHQQQVQVQQPIDY